MILIMIVIGLIIAGAGGYALITHKSYDSHLSLFGCTRAEYRTLSWPARDIIRDFQKLPHERRPDINIYKVLSALDTKHGNQRKVNDHFENFYEYNDWECRCNNKCKMNEYWELHNNVSGIHEDMAAQEYALEMANLASDVESGHELIAALKRERELLKEETQALTAKD